MKRTLPLAASVLFLGFAVPIAMARSPKTAPAPVPEPTAPKTMLLVEDETGQAVSMELDRYLAGVVLAELPGSFHPEVRRAQAIVSRTYALRRLGSGSHASGADLCISPGCCQAYREPDSREEARAALLAVQETADLVLTYDGELIDATFFSCSGGRTEAAVEVWGTEVPYLQPVDSPGEAAPHNEDTVFFSREDFARRLGLDPEREDGLRPGTVTYTRGGGVSEMEIGGRVYSGVELRRLLELRSTVLELYEDADGIAVTTRGFGHRVGMSQYGAQAMAEAGSDYRDILLHYYTGAALSPLGLLDS